MNLAYFFMNQWPASRACTSPWLSSTILTHLAPWNWKGFLVPNRYTTGTEGRYPLRYVLLSPSFDSSLFRCRQQQGQLLAELTCWAQGGLCLKNPISACVMSLPTLPPIRKAKTRVHWQAITQRTDLRELSSTLPGTSMAMICVKQWGNCWSNMQPQKQPQSWATSTFCLAPSCRESRVSLRSAMTWGKSLPHLWSTLPLVLGKLRKTRWLCASSSCQLIQSHMRQLSGQPCRNTITFSELVSPADRCSRICAISIIYYQPSQEPLKSAIQTDFISFCYNKR